MTRVLVSPEAITGLVSRLRSVRESLQDDVRTSAADVGGEDLADALADFSRNWRKRRQQITDDLAEAEQSLAGVSREFCAADRQLASTIGTGA